MAVTIGHGNPRWTKDETILALELYHQTYPNLPDPDDNKVIELSNLLRSFPYHVQASRQPSFRNTAGVSFKLQNLRSVATGKGLSNVSNMDKVVWDEFGNDAEKTKRQASLIRQGVEISHEIGIKEERQEYEVFKEGAVLTELHKKRERAPKLKLKLLASLRKKNQVCCKICGLKPDPNLSKDLAEAVFEAHHLLPLELGERKTRLSDLALLCANCHRLLHKAIILKKCWLTIEDVKKITLN